MRWGCTSIVGVIAVIAMIIVGLSPDQASTQDQTNQVLGLVFIGVVILAIIWAIMPRRP